MIFVELIAKLSLNLPVSVFCNQGFEYFSCFLGNLKTDSSLVRIVTEKFNFGFNPKAFTCVRKF